jgi:hypothetical protein
VAPLAKEVEGLLLLKKILALTERKVKIMAIQILEEGEP